MNDGGPAFPRTQSTLPIGGDKTQSGMSLRDYFAAQALTALISHNPCPDNTGGFLVELSYSFADGMLKEREKK